MHDGLMTALEGVEWRAGFPLRQIILITDEPGDPGGATREDVFGALPLPRILSKAGSREGDLKRDHTRVFAIFTGEAEKLAGFKANVREICYPQNVKWDEKLAGDHTVRDRIVELFWDQLRDAQERVDDRLQALANKLSGEESESHGINVLTAKALADALKRVGISEEDIELLQGVAYIDGYTSINQPDLSHPAFRPRVLLSRSDVTDVRLQAERIRAALKYALEREFESSRPLEQVLMALVLTIRKIGSQRRRNDRGRRAPLGGRGTQRSVGSRGRISGRRSTSPLPEA